MLLRTTSLLALATAVVCSWSAEPRSASHEPAPGHANDPFTTSEQCAVCHFGAPGATAMRDAAGGDVSPYATWRATMMANSFRDPYFRAQLRKESAAAGESVQELCLRCHAPMAHHERVLDGRAAPRLADVDDDLYADDGVSCTVCHTMLPDGLGRAETFSGRPRFDDQRRIFGPYADVFPQPMQAHVDYTPMQGEHVRTSALCATCHTLYTEHHGTPFAEQTPFLEWRNSAFADDRDGADPDAVRTCQQCHMPATGKTRIARNPMGFDFGRIAPREDYRAHAFVGGNAFVLELLAEHRDELYVQAEPEALRAMAAATRRQLAERTARLSISPLRRDGGALAFDVTVENLTGHKFPTGYPARRAWLRLEVLVGGEVVFASGAVDDEGRLRGVADEHGLPHVRTIERESDVVVYELVATDPDGRPTTFLTRMSRACRAAVFAPCGWRAVSLGVAHLPPVAVDGPSDFFGGGDTVACRVALPEGVDGACEVRATLCYQAVPPVWVDALRDVDAPEARRFVAYYDAARKRPELVATASRAED